jgi:nucleoside 2-deoxyribosyltransferase
MNKTVYLAGGITGLTFDEAVGWREEAEKKLAKYGVEVISPLRGKKYLKEIAGENTLKDHYENKAMSTSKAITCRDRNDVMRSGALLVNFLKCPRVSIGTVMEIAWADIFRVPTVVVMERDNLHRHSMILESVGFVTEDLDEGIDLIGRILGTGN